MLLHSIKFLILALILSFSLAIAQKRPPKSTDQLLETGHAAKLSTPATAPTEIKIVSYNIRWRSGKELEQIIERLRSKDAPPTTRGS
jgi:hypothetical protein